MFRYRITPKFQSAISLQWYVWAHDEHEARVKLCEILNSKNTHNYPPWIPNEFVATMVSRQAQNV